MISARIDHAAFPSAIVRAVVVDELHAFAGDDRGWHLLFLLARLERLTGRPSPAHRPDGDGRQPHELLDLVFDWDARAAWSARSRPDRGRRGHGRLTSAQSATRSPSSRVSIAASGGSSSRTAGHASRRSRRASGRPASGPSCRMPRSRSTSDGRPRAPSPRSRTASSWRPRRSSSASTSATSTASSRSARRRASPRSCSAWVGPGGEAATTRNCLFLATDDEELLASLAFATLWREGKVDPVVPPRGQRTSSRSRSWPSRFSFTVSRGRTSLVGSVMLFTPFRRADRAAIVAHMLESGILAEDAGILGLGVKGEEEVGRRHFSDLVAAFSEPLLLLVRHGLADLGSVTPPACSDHHGEPLSCHWREGAEGHRC